MKLKKRNFYAIIHTVQISVPIDKEKELLIPTVIYYTQQVFKPSHKSYL